MSKVYKNSIALGPDKKIYGIRTRKDYNPEGKEIFPVTDQSEVTEQALNVVAGYFQGNNLDIVDTVFGKLQLVKELHN